MFIVYLLVAQAKLIVRRRRRQMTKVADKLRHVYYDIASNSASLSGNAKILATAAGTSCRAAEKWLQSQPTYTLHRPAKRHYPTRQYMVHAVDEQWQDDLYDMQQLAKFNNGYRYILTIIETQGKEFENCSMHALMQKYHIELFSIKSVYKAALVERWNRTLKEQIWNGEFIDLAELLNKDPSKEEHGQKLVLINFPSSHLSL